MMNSVTTFTPDNETLAEDYGLSFRWHVGGHTINVFFGDEERDVISLYVPDEKLGARVPTPAEVEAACDEYAHDLLAELEEENAE